VLSRYGDDILSGWLENARKQPFHAMLPEGAVADHIPGHQPQHVDLADGQSPYRGGLRVDDHLQALFEDLFGVRR
jgi:hypothetical protein